MNGYDVTYLVSVSKIVLKNKKQGRNTTIIENSFIVSPKLQLKENVISQSMNIFYNISNIV